MQYEAAKIVTGAMKGTSKHHLMQEIGWEDLKTRRAIYKLLLYFKIVNNLCPSCLTNLLPLQVSERTNFSLRTASNYSLFASHSEHFKRSFFPSTTLLEHQTIIQAKQSLLSSNGNPWQKRNSTTLFIITMGSYDGAETCELVGCYLLLQLKQIPNIDIGLYRDDGLAILQQTPREIENDCEERNLQNICQKRPKNHY